jgi:hypothetical protein
MAIPESRSGTALGPIYNGGGECVLKADSTGYWVKHPFVNSHLQRTLATWAFKLCTSGGFNAAGVCPG